MSTPIDPALIAKLLKEEAEAPSRGTRGPRVDPTADRTYSGWAKLNHHICLPDCEHRTDPQNPTAVPIKNEAGGIVGFKPGAACWNPNCFDDRRIKDPNDEKFDRGIYIVNQVKGQLICRYCYIAGYLA